jgi:hypothetical protein
MERREVIGIASKSRTISGFSSLDTPRAIDDSTGPSVRVLGQSSEKLVSSTRRLAQKGICVAMIRCASTHSPSACLTWVCPAGSPFAGITQTFPALCYGATRGQRPPSRVCSSSRPTSDDHPGPMSRSPSNERYDAERSAGGSTPSIKGSDPKELAEECTHLISDPPADLFDASYSNHEAFPEFGLYRRSFLKKWI